MNLVIAGTYDQYRHYLHEIGKSPREYRYISHVDQLWGLKLSDCKIEYVGTWHERKDSGDIVDFINARLAQGG